MKFPIERLQILDYSEYDGEGNITIPCFDVAMSFFNKSEAETVMKQIISHHTVTEKLEQQIKNYQELLDCYNPDLHSDLLPFTENEIQIRKEFLESIIDDLKIVKEMSKN